ncbi:hypothetical protein [Bradyrhizobium sp. AZCC 1721]|jgi:hypothetical protein|uniref:hypothetical protein n=1 Tax=Bradyrhizobium sp. AZCC 1721 TaxID=3117016 RepID=UPI002FEF2C3C
MVQTDPDKRDYVSLALYEMATATEAPRQALAILQYGLLACALIGVVGSLVMLASEK